jgi:hypothetical protein
MSVPPVTVQAVVAWRDPTVWKVVAGELREHRRRGLGRLLTEDTVRFAAARALTAAGADPAGLAVEWPHPALAGSRIDLVAGGRPPAALIEFKYPREPNEKNAALTMAMGEVLKDFYRLAVYPGRADRLFVYAETARLRRFMADSAVRYGPVLDADHVTLRPAEAARLPTTAARIIGAELAAHHVTARRIALVPVDDALRLSVYAVDPLGHPPGPVPAEVAGQAAAEKPDDAVAGGRSPGDERGTGRDRPVSPGGTRDGVRREILAAVRAVLGRSGGTTFTPAQIVDEMARRGSGYPASTIRTMVTAHMCHNAPDNAVTTYDDLERVERGVYRLFSA